MESDPAFFVAIAGMAVLTFLTRIGGVWLAGRVPNTERLETWLRPVPGAILAAIVAPAAIDAGWRGIAAASIVAVVMIRTGNVLLAAGCGAAAIALLRAMI